MAIDTLACGVAVVAASYLASHGSNLSIAVRVFAPFVVCAVYGGAERRRGGRSVDPYDGVSEEDQEKNNLKEIR